MDRALGAQPTNAPVLASQLDHGELIPASLLDDDHTIYALLLGRSGGQTLIGGTGAGENLVLESTSHGTKGQVRAASPVVSTYAVPGGGQFDFAGSYTASAAVVLESVYRSRPTVSINSSVGYIHTAYEGAGTFTAGSTPLASLYSFLLFWAIPTLQSTGTYAPPASVIVQDALVYRNDGGAGTVPEIPTHTGLNFVPTLHATSSGDILRVADMIAVDVAPTFNTENATSLVDFGNVIGIRGQEPNMLFGGFQAGIEQINSFHLVEMLPWDGNLTLDSDVAVVYSAMAAAADLYFLRNIGGAASEDRGIFAWTSGGYPRVAQDGVGLVLGASDDVRIAWQSTNRLTWEPLNITAPWMGWFWNDTFNFLSAGQESGFTWGLRYQFSRFSWGADTVPDPTSVDAFFDVSPAERTPAGAGDWADLRVTAGRTAVLANALAMDDVDAIVAEPVDVTLTSGSIADLSTIHARGMGANGTRNQGLWIENARARFDGRLNMGSTTVSQLTGNTNNLAIPTGSSGRCVHLVSADGAYNLTGIVAGQDGDEIVLINTSANTITLTHDDTGNSTAANCFFLPGATSFALGQLEAIRLWYSSAAGRWLKCA